MERKKKDGRRTISFNNDKFIKFIRLIMKAYIHTFILEEMNILLFLSNSKTESNCFR